MGSSLGSIIRTIVLRVYISVSSFMEKTKSQKPEIPNPESQTLTPECSVFPYWHCIRDILFATKAD